MAVVINCNHAGWEKHDVPTEASAAGCTKDDAKTALLDVLITQAEKERKEKCSGQDCDRDGVCATYIDQVDWEELEKRVTLIPVRRKECPRGVGWLALLSSKVSPDKPKDQFTSGCICTPKPG